MKCDHGVIVANLEHMNHKCCDCGDILDEVAMELRSTVIALRAEVELLRKQLESSNTTRLDELAAIALKGLSSHYIAEDAARYAYEDAYAMLARKAELESI